MMEEFLKEVGFEYYKGAPIKIDGLVVVSEKQDLTGGKWMFKNFEEDFNTGSNYYITTPTKNGMIIAKEYYGSWSIGTKWEQYFVENIEELKILLKVLRIK